MMIAILFSGLSPMVAMQNVQQRAARQNWVQRCPGLTILGTFAALITSRCLYTSYQISNSPREICVFDHYSNSGFPSDYGLVYKNTVAFESEYLCDLARTLPNYVEVFESGEKSTPIDDGRDIS